MHGPPDAHGGEQRNPALEAAIASAPEERGGYLIYADWLQQHGEPRGELIVVQHAIATAPRDPALRAREAALFESHGGRLLGPLARVGDDARIDWHCGFVRSLELGSWLGADAAELAPLLAHPSLQFLHRFIGAVESDTLLVSLADRAPPTLRWLELSGAPDPIHALKARLGRLPPRLLGLEHLHINGRTYRGVIEWLADTSWP